jgi:hypothetical protein
MLVNINGRRFANETYFVDVARSWGAFDADCLFANLPCFLVFDARYRDKYGFPGGVDVRYLFTGGTLATLAAEVGIDAEGLRATVRAFNNDNEAGLPDAFGRGSTAYQRVFGDRDASGNPTRGSLTQPPFFAIEILPATSSHRGGVVIDAQARVISVDGRPIDGLYASGAVAAGTLTGGACFTGTAVGHALVFGTLAAEAMVRSSDLTRAG